MRVCVWGEWGWRGGGAEDAHIYMMLNALMIQIGGNFLNSK